MQTQSSDSSPHSDAGAPSTIGLLLCGACERLTYPATAYGCGFCGTPREAGSTFNTPARGMLRNWVTVYAEFNPALPAPYVVGELEFAPGVVEQVLVDVADESELVEGQMLVGVEPAQRENPDGKPARQTMRFVPENIVGSAK